MMLTNPGLSVVSTKGDEALLCYSAVDQSAKDERETESGYARTMTGISTEKKIDPVAPWNAPFPVQITKSQLTPRRSIVESMGLHIAFPLECQPIGGPIVGNRQTTNLVCNNVDEQAFFTEMESSLKMDGFSQVQIRPSKMRSHDPTHPIQEIVGVKGSQAVRIVYPGGMASALVGQANEVLKD